MRHIIAILVMCASVPSVSAGQAAPDGEQVYTTTCARCHDGTLPRMPSRDALGERSARQIQTAITSGVMRQFGGPLSAAERRAVAEFLSGDPAGTLDSPVAALPASAYCTAGAAGGIDLGAPAWNGWGADLNNRRFQTAEAAGMTADDVPRLRLKWAFGFPGVTDTGSQTTVVAGRALVGTRNGLVYALDAATGCVQWVHEAPASVRSAISVGPAEGGGHTAYFGDGFASVHAVDLMTGDLQWSTRVDDHQAAQVTGAPALHDGRLYVPVSSLEEVSAADPRYECCTFRGSVVALDAASGEQLWKTFVVREEPVRTRTNAAGAQNWGPSGAGIWSAPTLDPGRNLLYVATGDAYSDPAAPESDAIVALAMDTGEFRWVQQTTPGDAFTVACVSGLIPGLPDNPTMRANCPESAGPDFDYGSAPILITGPDGQDLVLAGQKSGVMYGMRPEDGTIAWETQVSDGGLIGGIEWGFATDGEQVFVSISDAMEKAPGEAGGVTALRVADGELIWHAPPVQDTCGNREGCHTAQPAAVTLIPGVVFAGSLDGHLRAHDLDTGQIIWDVDTAGQYRTVNGVDARGGSLNGPGPTIVDGMLYVVSGYGTFGYMPGNVLLAFGLE
ncbi:MAG: PQQ-binding-like beta-propeller repeat protein [Acidobacteria bacterium]|nr:PQQ-binding-like beta-propeller repeat protein [Acidobacteriota bacterium]